jgi:hypothetical protein
MGDSTQNSPTHHPVGGITHWVNHPQLPSTTQWVMGDLGNATLDDG